MAQRRILLIIGGGIAAYKCLELIRRAKDRGFSVRTIMTRAAEQFVTPLSVGALSNDRVLTELFDLNDEREIGHIRLSRQADLIVVAPATADLLAKMAGGHADDLATAVLLATDKPVLVAPAMNPRMWSHPATLRNVAILKADGLQFIGPNAGEMAESGEAGPGRMAEPAEILAAIEAFSHTGMIPDSALTQPTRGAPRGALTGRHVLVTAGPTHEPIDPVRYIANRSSGKQGYAIAAAAAARGARVTLISGPVSLAVPPGVTRVAVETAEQMLLAVRQALPADIGIFAAAVADWRVAQAADEKIKKDVKSKTPKLELVENPDILKTIAHEKIGIRPTLVIGFAAETEQVIEHARKKRKTKGCDWIAANDVSPATGVMGGDRNTVHLITGDGVESWPEMDKAAVAEALVERAATYLALNTDEA
jgi:phosphopantothenoylcysteine decarboxylase / phosphopantothenate---cysteine ligase